MEARRVVRRRMVAVFVACTLPGTLLVGVVAANAGQKAREYVTLEKLCTFSVAADGRVKAKKPAPKDKVAPVFLVTNNTDKDVTVTIHDADVRRQNFGQVSNAFIRVVNEDSGNEIVRYDLSEDASTETAMIFGEVYRYGGEWKFRAVGQGFAGGLGPLAQSFGVNV